MSGVESAQLLGQLQQKEGITDIQGLVELDSAILYRATRTAKVLVIEGIKTLRASITIIEVPVQSIGDD